MADITRYSGNVEAFGSAAPGTERTLFGNKAQADDLTSQINADYLRGWGIVGSNEFPTLEDFNAAFYTVSEFIAYLHQKGMAEWDGTQEYQVNSFVNRNGEIYICKTADHTSVTPPESDSTNWDSLIDLGTAAYEDVTTSPTDTTPGRLLKVGDYGVGSDAINYLSLTSMERQVAASSGGNLRLIYDDHDNPSYMYRVPKFNLADVGMPGTGVHPAFIVNGVEIPEFWVGAYQATVINGRAVSLPGMDPRNDINFDTAFNACADKGAGWHMMSNAEWSAVAALSKAMGTTPRGNTNYGRAYDATYESGSRVDNVAPGNTSGTALTRTGSGPASWNHNGQEMGIADLCGNMYEWQSGLRLDNGEIQIIPDNDAASALDNSANSQYWKAIMPNGTLVEPGTAGTLKYDATSAPTNSGIQIDNVVDFPSTNTTHSYQEFELMAADTGITVPDIMKQLGLAPFDTHDGDRLTMRSNGERLPRRGGSWLNSADTGLWALTLSDARSIGRPSLGFRPAFVDL